MRIILLFCAVILLGACQSSETTNKNPDLETDIILRTEDSSSNLSRLDAFIKNVNKGNKDKIRIVGFTIEADPIYHTLDYDGEEILYTFDNSEDEYGRYDPEEGNGVCESFEKEKTENGIKYYLTNCSSESAENFELEIPA